MASSHHILAKLHLCWVQQDEDQENSGERHHADFDVEMDDAKPLEDSESFLFCLVPYLWPHEAPFFSQTESLHVSLSSLLD